MNDFDKIKGYTVPSSGGTYLKLSDGEEVKVRLASLPVIFQNEYDMGEEVSISTRFGFVVYNHDLDKAQIWVTNAATYGQQISPLADDEEYGDWRKYDVKIKRTGEKAQTRYFVRAGKNSYDLEDDQQTACDNIDIIGSIKNGKGASQVMWLAEWRELEEESKQTSGHDKAKAVADKLKSKDEPLEDITDEIHLEDIPF